MKTYHLHLHEGPFEMIKSGQKTIEMRLLDEKRKLLQIGDEIIFTNRTNENDQIKTKIIGLHKFGSFKELYPKFNKCCLGYKENEVASYKDMQAFYPIEEQQKYGVIGIEIELLK